MDSMDLVLAKLEPLPQKPFPLPDKAPHLMAYMQTRNVARVHSSIDPGIQEKATTVIDFHHNLLSQNEIHNAGMLILETESGKVVAYIGNVIDPAFEHANAVDMIRAERSSGSILKPFLYAGALTKGMILPQTLIKDIPTMIRGYKPENFSRTYEGMVAADDALARSLNIPAVLLLKKYNVERFRKDLMRSGFTSIHYSAEHYGLPLILGGAEVSLWDLCGAYASMGRMLMHAYPYNHKYNPADIHAPVFLSVENQPLSLSDSPPQWSLGSIWAVFEALRKPTRPNEEGQWESFQSSMPVAWKTGTSYGFRDAWAVGITPKYTIGVWVGNADGEGRPGLVGIKTAAPILFDILRYLDGGGWFTPPFDDLVQLQVCSESGHKAGRFCTTMDTLWVPVPGSNSSLCPYHRMVHLDSTKNFLVNSECADLFNIDKQSWFVLEPLAEHYYKKHHPSYRTLPPVHPECLDNSFSITKNATMQLLYPQPGSRIYIPKELDGEKGKSVFKAAHRHHDSRLFWYLDKSYIGSTSEFHSIELSPPTGDHMLVLLDQQGNRIERAFHVLSE
jgi:penicillin-binding protein 1C